MKTIDLAHYVLPILRAFGWEGRVISIARLKASAFLGTIFALCVAPYASAASDVVNEIGVATFLVTDAGRKDTLKSALPRSWMVDVYYPAARAGHAPSPYFEDSALLKLLIEQKYYGVKSEEILSWAKRTGPAVRGAKQREGMLLPLLTIAPGMGTARGNYGMLAAAFVRRGFVVAVIDLPYLGIQRLPGGRVLDVNDDPLAASENPMDYAPRIREFTRDVSVTLDRLPEHLRYDRHRITATGHSSGGTVAVDVCGNDARVAACIDMEGGMEGTKAWEDGASKPTLVAASRAKGRPETPLDPHRPDMMERMRLALGKKDNKSCWVVKITGGSHMSYSDFPDVFPYAISQFGGEIISSDRSFDLYTGIVAAFAHAYEPEGGGNKAFEAFLKAQAEVTRVGRTEGK